MFFRMVYKPGPIFLPFCHKARVWHTDRRTDGQTEFSSLDRVCIACSAVKTVSFAERCYKYVTYNNQLRAPCCVDVHWWWVGDWLSDDGAVLRHRSRQSSELAQCRWKPSVINNLSFVLTRIACILLHDEVEQGFRSSACTIRSAVRGQRQWVCKFDGQLR